MKNIYIAVPYGFSAASAYSLFEVLKVSTMVRDASELAIHFLSPKKEMVSYLGTNHLFKEVRPGKIDVLVVAGSAGASIEEIFKHLAASEDWMLKLIKLAKSSGALITSSCSGAYFLAKAGLLKNKEATSAWWITPLMSDMFPDTIWVPEKIIVSSGKVITSGGSMSALDLSAELMARFMTTKTKYQTEKMLVLPYQRKNQMAYKVNSTFDNPQVVKALKYIKDHLSTCSTDDLMSHMGMSQRTLHRFCMKHVKLSPYQWIIELRMERAQRQLDQTQNSIEDIALDIGYENLSSFQKAFKKIYGISPDKYRKKVFS